MHLVYLNLARPKNDRLPIQYFNQRGSNGWWIQAVQVEGSLRYLFCTPEATELAFPYRDIPCACGLPGFALQILIRPYKIPYSCLAMQRQPEGLKQICACSPKIAPTPAGGVSLRSLQTRYCRGTRSQNDILMRVFDYMSGAKAFCLKITINYERSVLECLKNLSKKRKSSVQADESLKRVHRMSSDSFQTKVSSDSRTKEKIS
jgi:hypothetical protein